MAASVKTRGRLTDVEPSSLLVAVSAWLAVIAALLAAPSTAWAQAASGVIYTNAPQGYSSADLGSSLLHSLGENFKFTLAGVDGDRDVMQRVAADPRSVGLVQRDRYVQYLRD